MIRWYPEIKAVALNIRPSSLETGFGRDYRLGPLNFSVGRYHDTHRITFLAVGWVR